MLSCVLLLIISLFCSVAGLEKGEVAYKTWKISEDELRLHVTDGNVVVMATTSLTLDDMISCRMYKNSIKAHKLLNGKGVKVENIGENQILLMKQKCKTYHGKVRRATSTDDGGDKFNEDLVKGKPFQGDFGTGAPSGAGSHFAIFPGTKWCGYENVASSMKDLGVHNETDACCRTHDHCPYYIDRFQTKFHYFNYHPWTVSYCDCDKHLFECLKKVNNPTSNTVGNLFFGLLDVQCFTFKTGEYCENEGSILSHLWCPKKTGDVAVMQQFPLKWTNDNVSSNDVIG